MLMEASPEAPGQTPTSLAGRATHPTIVEADPDRIRQVLLILLDNAIKHTPAGGQVTVQVRQHGADAILEVVDTGTGIPAEHLPRIFDRFYRADLARSRAEGGTGLGLAIAKALVEAHSGTLTLASTFGIGTRATIRLRLEGTTHRTGRLGGLATRLTHSPTALDTTVTAPAPSAEVAPAAPGGASTS
jgi:signal transduction histidine kinase